MRAKRARKIWDIILRKGLRKGNYNDIKVRAKRAKIFPGEARKVETEQNTTTFIITFKTKNIGYVIYDKCYKKKIAIRQSILEELLLFIVLCSQWKKSTVCDASEASEKFFKNRT